MGRQDTIHAVSFQNFGKLKSFQADSFSGLNLIIGENGSGKTFFLKGLYSAVKAAEEYKRGDDVRSYADILAEKLRWIFQVENLGDMVSKSASRPLDFSMELGDEKIAYHFSRSAKVDIGKDITPPKNGREANSVFIPAKEILSLYSVILKSREIDRSFGFDDTYYDLTKALRAAPTKEKNDQAFAGCRERLSAIIGGRVDMDQESGKWYYRNLNKEKFSIGATSEGIKKLSILDRLLGNRYLDGRSIVFIDELESALHPTAICEFLDILSLLSREMGIQFFISSHSYFVVKKLAIIAAQGPGIVQCIALDSDGGSLVTDLHDGLPDNAIINTSIRLYEEELEATLP